jgi:hypothetical protein
MIQNEALPVNACLTGKNLFSLVTHKNTHFE